MRNSPRHNEGLIATDFSATLGEIADASVKSEDSADGLAVAASASLPPLEAELEATAVVQISSVDKPSANQGAVE